MDVCIVEQNDDAPAGLLAEWAAERGHRVITLQAAEIGAGPWPDPTRYGAVIPLGAEQSVERSPDPWIAPEVALTNPIGCNVKWDGKDAHWMPPDACDLVQRSTKR